MINKYESDLKKIATDCHKQSGLIYEIFCDKFNSELILYLSDKSVSERIKIIEIAKRIGFNEQEIDIPPYYDYIESHNSNIEDQGYKESLFIHNEINNLRGNIIKGKSISPIQWCSLKLFITKNGKAIYWFSLIFTHNDELSSFSDIIKYLQSELIIPEYPF